MALARDIARMGNTGGFQRVIEIENLSFRYPGAERDALSGLSLRVRRGSLFGLLGPNGSGKTTLISILNGLLSPAAGRVRVAERDLPDGLHAAQAVSALVPQEYAFYPRLSVRENLRFFAGVLGLRGSELRTRLDDAITIAGLDAFRSNRAGNLSGGLKRRLNLAIGLLNRPQLLFLDEPTVGIDPQSRRFILDAIRRLNRDGTTIVYTSHYMEEVEALCDEIGVLDEGALIAHGTLQQLLDATSARVCRVQLDATPAPEQYAALAQIPGLSINGAELVLDSGNTKALEQLFTQLSRNGSAVRRMQYGHGNLEELFLHLTGRQLRD